MKLPQITLTFSLSAVRFCYDHQENPQYYGTAQWPDGTSTEIPIPERAANEFMEKWSMTAKDKG